MIIRPAEQQDLPAIREIYNEAILNTTAVYEYEPFTADYIEKWFSEKQEKQWPVIVADENGTITGFASYGSFRARAAYRYAVEHSVYVHHDHRGKGIGRDLLVDIIRKAEENNIHVMVAGIDASNDLSIEFHRKMGFTEVARLHEVAFKFGRWLDLVFMEKHLVMHTPPRDGE